MVLLQIQELIQLPNLIKKKCFHCGHQELDVLAAITRSFIDLKEEKQFISGFTVYKCTKCHRQMEILRDENERKSVSKFISPKVCLIGEKKLPKDYVKNLNPEEKSTIKKLGSKITGKKDEGT